MSTNTKKVNPCNPAFLNFKSNLDNISSEIKQLESDLRECGICIPFDMVSNVANTFHFWEEEYLSYDLEKIAWVPDDQGKFRLFYLKGHLATFENSDMVKIGDTNSLINEKERIPLIETKAEVRLRMRQSLKMFEEKFAQFLSPDMLTEAKACPGFPAGPNQKILNEIFGEVLGIDSAKQSSIH